MHKPNYLRAAFEEWVNAGMEVDTIWLPTRRGEVPESASWMIGQLWACTDVMPAELCRELGMSEGLTYAQAVRTLRGEGVA